LEWRALHGVLSKIEAMGLELVEVRRIRTEAESGPKSPEE